VRGAVCAPGRKPLQAANNWGIENSTSIKNLAEYVAPREIISTDELESGQGAIIREGLKKIAAFACPGVFTGIPSHALALGAICTGTAFRIAGIVRVMARSLGMMELC
jgi:hypothetical protein